MFANACKSVDKNIINIFKDINTAEDIDLAAPLIEEELNGLIQYKSDKAYQVEIETICSVIDELSEKVTHFKHFILATFDGKRISRQYDISKYYIIEFMMLKRKFTVSIKPNAYAVLQNAGADKHGKYDKYDNKSERTNRYERYDKPNYKTRHQQSFNIIHKTDKPHVAHSPAQPDRVTLLEQLIKAEFDEEQKNNISDDNKDNVEDDDTDKVNTDVKNDTPVVVEKKTPSISVHERNTKSWADDMDSDSGDEKEQQVAAKPSRGRPKRESAKKKESKPRKSKQSDAK